ncbi:MAG: efflux RND transporter periplasmic adaptor subunit [Burkholderiales bacterium]|nr:efflux RND transporter periplasmic adaptor subunit [Burkholderiales bacterium]
MRNKLLRYLPWLLVLVLAAAVVMYTQRTKPVGVDIVVAKANDVQTSVVASGRVLAPARVDIGATLTGRVEKVVVREGARIAAGDLLVQLEKQELSAAAAQALAARDRARARVTSVATLALPTARSALLQAEANAAVAEREWRRAQDLVAKGFISKSKLDETERQLTVARSQVEAARAQVSAQDVPGAEAQQARSQLVEAEAALDLARARLAQTDIRAPGAGVVLERLIEPGDIAQPGKRMMSLALEGPARLIVQVDEKNLPLIEVGRTALAAADAFPNQRFEAVIAYVSQGVDASRGTVELRLDVAQPPDFLKPDMTVTIDLAGPLLKQALFLPSEAIHQLQSDAPYVLLDRSGRAVKAAIKLGLQTQGRVQVVEGIRSGDRVILNGGVEDGAHVRERL